MVFYEHPQAGKSDSFFTERKRYQYVSRTSGYRLKH